MKNEKSLFIVLFLVVFFLLPYSLYGWELEAHGEINKAAFRYYGADRVASETKFAGISWHDDAYPTGWPDIFFYKSYTFIEWLEAGGIDADISSPDKSSLTADYPISESEKPLRHFYDPELLPSYLTDQGYATYAANWLSINPQINHVDWAIQDANHHYAWFQALLLYKAGMEIGNNPSYQLPADLYMGYFFQKQKPLNVESLKQALFAASFRALGETMHGLADMTQPAHVRDDAHAGTGKPGGTEPIEANVSGAMVREICYENELHSLKQLSLPSGISVSGKQIKPLMKDLAKWTNNNFFSSDTVSDGKKVFPRKYSTLELLTDIKLYPLPSFSSLDKKTFLSLPIEVSSQFSNSAGKVRLAEYCLSNFLFGPNDGRLDYHVPAAYAREQANVLIPLAVIACSEAIERFFPKLSMWSVISDLGTTISISGEVRHDSTGAWQEAGITPIKYSGKGKIQNKRVGKTTFEDLFVCNFAQGQMEEIFVNDLQDGDTIRCVIEAGAKKYTLLEYKFKLTPNPLTESLKNIMTPIVQIHEQQIDGLDQMWYKREQERCRGVLDELALFQKSVLLKIQEYPQAASFQEIARSVTAAQQQVQSLINDLYVVEISSSILSEMQSADDMFSYRFYVLNDKLNLYDAEVNGRNETVQFNATFRILGDYAAARDLYRSAQRLYDSIMQGASTQKYRTAEQIELDGLFSRFQTQFLQLGNRGVYLESRLKELESQIGQFPTLANSIACKRFGLVIDNPADDVEYSAVIAKNETLVLSNTKGKFTAMIGVLAVTFDISKLSGSWSISDATTKDNAFLAPSLNRISPNPIIQSNTRQWVDLYGGNFLNSGLVIIFRVGGIDYPISQATTDRVQFVDSTHVRVLAGLTDAGIWEVRVVNSDGQSTSAISFQVKAP